MNFNKDTRIGEILEKAPEKAEILLEIGMHCLGCPASQMETLEEACDVHGIIYTKKQFFFTNVLTFVKKCCKL